MGLRGATVVVTRAREQAGALSEALAARGARPLEVPLIAVAPPADGGAALRGAAARLGRYDWVVLTSANGVAALADAVVAPEDLRSAPIAVVGSATAASLRRVGIEPALVPDRFVAEGLLASFPDPPAAGGRVLLAQAEGARAVLAEGLAARGWSVEAVVAYRTVPVAVEPEVRERVARADAVTFLSSSSVEQFVAAVGAGALPPVVACIGPVTAATAAAHGIEVQVVAEVHTVGGLVDALDDHLARSSGARRPGGAGSPGTMPPSGRP